MLRPYVETNPVLPGTLTGARRDGRAQAPSPVPGPLGNVGTAGPTLPELDLGDRVRFEGLEKGLEGRAANSCPSDHSGPQSTSDVTAQTLQAQKRR